MGQGYTRNDTTNNIANGNVISAADLDGEFDAIVASFNETTGHTHDGTVAEGGAVSVIGPVQEYLGDGAAFYPKTTAVYTLGKASNVWANLHLVTLTLSGTATMAIVDINGGNIDGTTIGATTPAVGSFTSVNATTAVNVNSGTPTLLLNETDTTTFGRILMAASLLRIEAGDAGLGASGAGDIVIQGYGGVQYTSLELKGPTSVTSTLKCSDGSQGNPSITTTTDPDTGFYYNSANSLGVTSAGTHMSAFTSTGFRVGASSTLSANPSITVGESGCVLQTAGRLSASYDAGYALDLNRNGAVGSIAIFRSVNATVGSISVTGSSTAFNTTSDYRTKENITPIQGPVELIRALNPVTYTAISDGQWYDGFLAHEIQGIIPTAVTGELDGDEMQSMDYAKLTPLLTAGLQAALDKIDTLTARIEALEALQ
jgi:hypothetical protein